MRTLYLDCFAGVSGDMFVGALLDLGASECTLREALALLPLKNYRLDCLKESKNGITGTRFIVSTHVPEAKHRHLSFILDLIDKSNLSSEVKTKSNNIFKALAQAEGKVHGTTPEQVHFHEVGAIDSIIDIVAAVICLEQIGVQRVICSPVPLGRGYVSCAHGTIPLPAPAVLELLKGVPIKETDITGETVTPTGAALITQLSDTFGPLPSIKVLETGYGAGAANRTVPNLLRMVLGEDILALPFLKEKIIIVTTVVDDMNPEFWEHIVDRLFKAGAFDVTLTPVYMKKTRPAQELGVLCTKDRLNPIVEIILSQTTSLGLRVREESRYLLERKVRSINTCYGPIRVKLGILPGTKQIINVAPEWEDCRRLAEATNTPVKVIYDEAKYAARQLSVSESQLR